MARRKLLVIVFSLLMALLVAGCGQENKETPGAGENEAIPVEVVTAEKDVLLETTVVTGKLEAAATSNVVPGGQPGRVEAVNVRVGQTVNKGQRLVTLENTVLQLAIKQAEQGIITAELALETAGIDYNKKKSDYERNKMLFEQGAIPQAGPAGLETYEMAYQVAEQGLKQAESGIEAARVGLEMARENYEHAFITAPISGVATAVNVDPGELASSAMPVVSIADLASVKVKATVVEDMVNLLRVGDAVEVKVAAVSPEPFTGKVVTIAPAADQGSKAFPVEVQINNPGGKLKPGMFAEISFVRQHPENILIPKKALLGTGGDGIGNEVWVIKDGQAKRCKVETGVANSELVTISTGLKGGEQVVITGMESLREGLEVEIKEAAVTKTEDQDQNHAGS